jgi:diacylglycerol O-acyltransferase
MPKPFARTCWRGSTSPLDRPAGPHREVAFVAVPLDELRHIARGMPDHATVNDVVLAVVCAGLRDWLAALGATASGLRLKVPVSLHHRDERDVANRDSFMIVDLPLDASDPIERLRAVARATRERKLGHDARTLAAFFRDLGHARRHASRVAVVSAAGRISVGLCADPDAVGDLGVTADGIEREINALGAAVGGPR